MDISNENFSTTEMVNILITFQITTGVFLLQKRGKRQNTYFVSDLAFLLPSISSKDKKINVHRKTLTEILMPVLYTVAKSQKQFNGLMISKTL